MKRLFSHPTFERRRPRTPGPMFCRACGYQIDNLTESRCAECGQVFNAADARTYLHEPPESPARSIGSVILGITIVAAIAAVVFLVVFILALALRGP